MKVTRNKALHFLNRRTVHCLLSLCLFLLMVGFGYLRATKGIDLTDEGSYLSTAMRYSLGDVPFRDEFMNTVRPFDLLVSPVFIVFPDISLLQMRSLGLILEILSLLTLFLFFSRYAPPLLVAFACSVAFFINCGILSPSYNSLSRGFSTISLTFYLFSCVSEGRYRRISLSALGGAFFSLCVLSYPSQILLLIIPIAAGVFSLLSPTRRDILWTPWFVFVGTFVSLMAFAFILLISFGLLPDFVEGFSTMRSITPFGSGPWVKSQILLRELLQIMPYGLGILCVYLVAFLIVPANRRRFDFIFAALAVAIMSSIFAIPSPPATLKVFVFAVILPFVGLLLKYRVDSQSSSNINWNMIRNSAIAWGFFLALLYGTTSGNSVLQCRNGIAPLLAVGIVTLYRFVDEHARSSGDSMRRLMWPVLPYLMIIPFCFAGLKYSYHNIYRDLDVHELTARFKHPKLKGIYSTPEKVAALGDLLDYLDERVKPRDYFLAYNYIPMLYFLTHSRPAYGAAWARDDWPLPVRQRLLSKMIQQDRIPEYCVRMLTWPVNSWKRVMPYDDRGPLDLFLNSNYYLEHIIYPFEIWHRGKGPRLRAFDQMSPMFQDSFNNWKGPATVPMRQLATNAPPLILQGFRGDFNFSKISDRDGERIRVSPFRKGEKGSMWVQFGYTSGENGFEVDLRPGQQVIFTISARLFEKPIKPALLFIRDKTTAWNTNSVFISNTSWERYIVSKRIRGGATTLALGINWEPRDEGQWLEIKDIRIYTTSRDSMEPVN
jgi:hypothetical protein